MERSLEDGTVVMSICTPDLGITQKGYTTPQPSQPLLKNVVIDGAWELASPSENVSLTSAGGKTSVTATCKDGQPVEFRLKRI